MAAELPAPAGTDNEVEVWFVLRPREEGASLGIPHLGSLPPLLRDHLEPEELEHRRGARTEELDRAAAWARSHGLQVVGASLLDRRVRISGSEGEIRALLGRGVGGTGGLEPPEELRDAVVAVLGLGTTPFARPHFRPFPLPDLPLPEAAPLSFTAPEIAALYQFPAAPASGLGCLGLIELGGGYEPSSLAAYFTGLGLPVPQVATVPVLGSGNLPTGDPQGPDGEVTLDIEVAGALVPGARIAAYFAPNTDQGFLAAIQAATHDLANRPQVLSISWGGPEPGWPPGVRAAFEHAFEDAALVGITVCVAAGDSGSSDGMTDGLAHVDYPAASPLVLACGGTRLLAAGGGISSEVVWNDLPAGGATGGGVSRAIPLPSWQSGAGVPPDVDPGRFRGRGVPDVAGCADPETGYRVLVDGQAAVFGGTSAVAPLWGALVLVCSAQLGRRLGLLNPLLYSRASAEGAFRDITRGDNGAYRAKVGWDPCTGWGSPVGAALLRALGA